MIGLGIMSASHYQYDPKTKEFFNYVYPFGPSVEFSMFSISPNAESPKGAPVIERFEKFPPPYLSYAHSFSLTTNYLVMIFQPLHVKNSGISVLMERNILDSLKWDSQLPTWFYVLDRKTKKLVNKMKTESFFYFHTVNAYDIVSEGKDTIVLDLGI